MTLQKKVMLLKFFFSFRLSRFASQQLTSGNPNIADLSDRNRPTKIGEMFGQLYDNEWSDAFDSLKMSTGNVTNETMSSSPKSDKIVKKEMKRSRQEKDHSMRRELSGDRSNEKEKVIQSDDLLKSQKQSTRREDDRSGDIFNDDEHIDVNKDVDAASSVRGKKKTVAENIKKSAVTLVEKGVEGDGVESKQDIPDENSKEQAEENIKVREHSDKESGKCEGAEGGKDEERKEVEEVVEEEEDDFNMKELTILQGIVMVYILMIYYVSSPTNTTSLNMEETYWFHLSVHVFLYVCLSQVMSKLHVYLSYLSMLQIMT